MKRYECYFIDHLGYRGEALSEENLDGDFVRFEDAQTVVAPMALAIKTLRDELTAMTLERDALKNTMRLIEVQDQGCGGNLKPEEIYRAMQKLASEALK